MEGLLQVSLCCLLIRRISILILVPLYFHFCVGEGKTWIKILVFHVSNSFFITTAAERQQVKHFFQDSALSDHPVVSFVLFCRIVDLYSTVYKDQGSST